ncbi:MAG: sulfatase-like hydrolase/transferase, partial [Myxococcota bacterium]
AEQSVRFWRAYANPVCSQSRASLLTGRHVARSGVGRWGNSWLTEFDMPLQELIIPEILSRSEWGYSTAALGKWHLVRFEEGGEPGRHPLDAGFDRHRGSLANPRFSFTPSTQDTDYFYWEKNTDGVLDFVDTYMTTDTTNEAILAAEELPEPWLLWVAYNGAHGPNHVPPIDLITEVPAEDADTPDLFDAMLEALDTEIGRLLAGVEAATDRDTWIIFVADNGTPGYAVRSPWRTSRSKGTVFEGGVRVPMLISGPDITAPGADTDALVHFVDLLPTIMDLADIDTTDLRKDNAAADPITLDGQSLVPILRAPSHTGFRDTVYTEQFQPGGAPPYDYHERTIRNDGFKLIQREEAGGVVSESFYELDPVFVDEGFDLLSIGGLDETQQDALRTLREALDERMDVLQFEP